MVSIFMRIPVKRSTEIIIDHLQRRHIPNAIVEEFRDHLNHCVGNNLRVFKETTYKFPDGIPMGEPLSMLAREPIYSGVADVGINGHFPEYYVIRGSRGVRKKVKF